MKRVLALLAASLMLCTAAFAQDGGVRYSARFRAVNAAQHALAEKYSVSEGMNEYFVRTVSEQEDGSWLVLWEPAVAEGPLPWLLGTYTAQVEGERVDISWSHDGEETYGGYTAPAWGALQLRDMCDEVRTSFGMEQSMSAAERSVYAAADDYPLAGLDSGFDNGETARASAAAAARITVAEAEGTALAALREVYGNLEWWRLENMYDEMTEADTGTLCGRPAVRFSYVLWGQGRDDWNWKDGDGYYTVWVNLQTGEVEEILYCNGLSGNG